MVRRPREPDGHLVRRLHRAPGRDPPAAAPDLDHPGRRHRRPLHRRLPLPRRPAADVLRPRLVRHADDRVERDAARSGRSSGDDWAAIWRRSTSTRTSPTCSPGCGTRSTARTGGTGSVGGTLDGSCARHSSSAAGATAIRTRRCGCSPASRAPKKLLIGPVGPRLPGCRHPGSADRPPAGGGPLAGPLVPRSRHGAAGRAADRRSTCRKRDPGAGPARRAGRVACGARLAGPGATRRVLTLRRGRLSPAGDARGRAPGEDRLTRGPDRRRRRAAYGRAACPSACPTTSDPTRPLAGLYTSAPLDAPLTILGRARADPAHRAARRSPASPCRSST